MRLDKVTIRVLVRGDYGGCYDFYTEKLGLVPVWGDRQSGYTSFAVEKDAPPCLAIFSSGEMAAFPGYTQPAATAQPDTIVAVIPSSDLDTDYERLLAVGVEFIGPPQRMEEWGMRCTYFRDPEGNLFELNDATSI